MADQKLMIDTSILIDYFRKSEKEKSLLVRYFQQYPQLYISSITEFEIYNGATEAHKAFWKTMLSRLIVLDFDSASAIKAAEIVSELKLKRKTIDKPDLFIAATAIVNDLPLSTLNQKHFVNIDALGLLGKE